MFGAEKRLDYEHSFSEVSSDFADNLGNDSWDTGDSTTRKSAEGMTHTWLKRQN